MQGSTIQPKFCDYISIWLLNNNVYFAIVVIMQGCIISIQSNNNNNVFISKDCTIWPECDYVSIWLYNNNKNSFF